MRVFLFTASQLPKVIASDLGVRIRISITTKRRLPLPLTALRLPLELTSFSQLNTVRLSHECRFNQSCAGIDTTCALSPILTVYDSQVVNTIRHVGVHQDFHNLGLLIRSDDSFVGGYPGSPIRENQSLPRDSSASFFGPQSTFLFATSDLFIYSLCRLWTHVS